MRCMGPGCWSARSCVTTSTFPSKPRHEPRQSELLDPRQNGSIWLKTGMDADFPGKPH